MISIVVSALSVVVVITVTAILIHKSYADEANRKSELRSIVNQINETNKSSEDIEKKQNNTLSSVTKRMEDLVNKDIPTFAKKEDMNKEVVSSKGTFDSLDLKGVTLQSTDGVLNVKNSKDNSSIVGFDGTGKTKRLLVGSELSLLQNDNGDVIMKTETDKGALRIQNKDGNGIIMKGNKIGVGIEPSIGNLDVNGAIWAKDGVMTSIKGKSVSMFDHDDDFLYLNKNSEFTKGVKVNSDVVIGGNIVMDTKGNNKWVVMNSEPLPSKDPNLKQIEQTDTNSQQPSNILNIVPNANGKLDYSRQFSFDDKGYMSAIGGGLNIKGGNSEYNPKNLNTQFPSDKDGRNYIRGDTDIQGELYVHGPIKMARPNPGAILETANYGTPGDKFGIGQYDTGAMRMYTSSSQPGASVNLSIANKNGTFEDIMKVNNNRLVEANGPFIAYQMMLSPYSFANNVYSNKSMFANLNQDTWSVYNNNKNKMVFTPGDMSTRNESNGMDGVFSINDKGDVTGVGNATFKNIKSETALNGTSLCLGNQTGAQCLTDNDIMKIKNLIK